ncbi:hypothetical protein BOX15_Mlig014066g1, partial [Macrostomum lignano]
IASAMNTSVMDVDSSDEARARPRVNGGLLAQHQGACVCLLGRVVSCPSPTCLLLEASDSVQVKAQLSREFHAEPGSLVEVVGSALSDNSVSVQHLVQLDRGCSENFDMDMYNKAVQICNKFSHAYYTKP